MRWLAVAACLAATQAQALSCMAPDLARDYRAADAAAETYVILVGRLTFDEALLPKAPVHDINAAPPDTRIPARFDGHGLAHSGPGHRVDTTVTLSVPCWGPWCGGAQSGLAYLAFAQKTTSGYVIEANPCGGFLWPDPSQAVIGQARDCLAGGPCEPTGN